MAPAPNYYCQDRRPQSPNPRKQVYLAQKSFVIQLFFFNVYLFLRQRESMSGGGAEREGDTESEAAPGSELSAQSPTRGLNLNREIVT